MPLKNDTSNCNLLFLDHVTDETQIAREESIGTESRERPSQDEGNFIIDEPEDNFLTGNDDEDLGGEAVDTEIADPAAGSESPASVFLKIFRISCIPCV